MPTVTERARSVVAGETVAVMVAAHRAGASVEATVARAYARGRAHNDPARFITLREEADAMTEAKALAGKRGADRAVAELPLYGVPVAIKDNIDVAGLPTTAACPAFAYVPEKDATCVARLKRAGAIVIGKTNLDQFATGLEGVRTPYGIPRNLFDKALIPGGSSAGSAVAIAAGLVPLALGTDTAGSGRVPAALSNTVGLKPSLGLVSNAGVVPACRTLDCVSVHAPGPALPAESAAAAPAGTAGPAPADPYSRKHRLSALGAVPSGVRVGAPRPEQRLFFGDAASAAAYDDALARLARLGARIVTFHIAPFFEAARLLYDGPSVAERHLAARAVIEKARQEMHPVTRQILLAGAKFSAADAFAAFYRLEELRRVCAAAFRAIDMMALPTVPTVHTVEQARADPIALNSRLGTHTNFVNLLDLCALAVPASARAPCPA